MLCRSVWLLMLMIVSEKLFSQDSISYELDIRPLLSTSCFKCHDTGNPKGGVNLDNYKERERVIEDGQFWLKVLDQIRTRDMPPKSERPLSENDYLTLVEGINGILQSSLQQKRPGQIVIRRLSHSEYRYTIQDLMQVDFDAKDYFPSDGSGGGGFDNQGGALFFTPLKLERYYDAAGVIVEDACNDQGKWAALVPISYKQNWWQRFRNWFKSVLFDQYEEVNPPALAAEKVIFPFATKAYRRFLKEEEKIKMIHLFQTVYDQKDSIDNPQRFNESVAQTFKSILISPNFLYRVEEEPAKTGVYPLSNFEVATRLSYFLWSSMPDDELFNLAYMGKLEDTLVLESQVKRMLADSKAKRFAENFSTQWLGITKLIDNQPLLDPEKYPGFDMPIRKALYSETVEYFYYVLTRSKKMLELINSNYTFLNKELADFYGIDGVTGEDLQMVLLNDSSRGGVLGMGSVLSTTSFPLRTSPVIRGKWVMEQLLGISPPPPPPVVAELTEDKNAHEEVGLRRILEMHRASPECNSCHVKMDPLGLGLENFDPTGRWRTTYGKAPVDPSGVMADGRSFQGPAELKMILLTEKAKIARNLSSRMLSYALGRSVQFTDEPALQLLDQTLLKTNFNPENFIIEIVKSYPFRMKVNDFEKKV
jgi:Protein of unknown function (DUF1592)/Protein of unknown function (DUF1588)/Protein of unknown function (DUF1587)/Protein of unknown function (DUF1585)/Protein of unknown function (DUF1595)/Planctomycete cytochrome C